MRRLVTGLLAGALLIPGTPAVAADERAPVSLVVGLRSGHDVAGSDDVAGSLDQTVDVLDSRPLSGALTVDVPAGQVTAATDALRADPAVEYVEVDHVAHADVAAADPYFDSQWGLTRTRVDAAWASVRGSGVTIAVVDTGVKAMPDLAGRLLPGYDFVNNDSHPDDDNGHGTMSAGVIAAAGDNGVGIAGICWLCRILPVKVLDSAGSGSYSAIAEGIRYAADHDADIISLSLGGSSDSELLRDAVTYAVGKGALVIAAAGNSGSPNPHFPAAIPAVLAVGGATSGDARYPWSNYGRGWVDIAAPGCNPAQGIGGVVSQFCGTSSATPFVAGIAALLKGTTPAPSPATIRAALMSSAVPLAGNWVAAKSGRINARAALDALPFWVTGVRSGAHVGDRIAVMPHVGAGAGITRVTAALDGATADTATAAPWTLGVDTSHVTGAATITVTAYAGSTPRSAATFPVVADHAIPVVAFRSPARNALVRGRVTVAATASDHVAVARVQLLADGKAVGTDTTAPYAFGWQTAPRNATVTLTLRAYDQAGNVASVRRIVTADNRAPTVVITAGPANGTRGVRKTQYVTARAADQHGIARLELVVDGTVTQRYAGTRHTFSVQSWKHGSAMTVQVRAYDAAGNVRTAPARKWYR
jgi:subtilisin family serine protease